ncbi:hypothetical protein [Leptospira kmetyi]|uniref:hypothetical protein n=1 Tax=Leptospira kmetyi TaxID=408139 RepID=UPI001082755F|nr:hypothetical protein [Leptospira kmetyi]TGK21802.1 hypothetical protein EHO62_05195 [Leptospira kmetyi]TGK26778.1 hypothetical protein EHO66_18710 [Leptospira kmetyi]
MDPVKKAIREKERLQEAERFEVLRNRSRRERMDRWKERLMSFFDFLAGTAVWIGIKRYFRFLLADLWIVNYTFIIFLLLMGLPSFYVLCLLPYFFASPIVKIVALLFPSILLMEWFRQILFERALSRLVISVRGYREILDRAELGYYSWFELELKVVASRNQEAVAALLESFTIRSKKLFYPHDWDMKEPRTFWTCSYDGAAGSANSRVVLFLFRDLLVKLNRLHKFDPSIESVTISVLSGPIEVEARSNQANSD